MQDMNLRDIKTQCIAWHENARHEIGGQTTEIYIVQFLLLLFSKHATVLCTWRELLRIKKRQCSLSSQMLYVPKNIKIPNKVIEIIYCHCNAAASIMRAKVLSVVSYTHASPSGYQRDRSDSRCPYWREYRCSVGLHRLSLSTPKPCTVKVYVSSVETLSTKLYKCLAISCPSFSAPRLPYNYDIICGL